MPEPKKADHTTAKRQRDYYARMKKAGYKKFTCWVPADRIAELQAFVKNLKKDEPKT